MREITLRELQLFSLEIMKDIHKFCENNGIEYSLLDGSLIGAIRHQGFIPWDDDIDIVMRRPDFERFCKTYKSDEYQLKYRGNGQDCMVPFARVYDVKRTVIKTTAPWCLDEVGVWVDVMPADNVIDDVEQFDVTVAEHVPPFPSRKFRINEEFIILNSFSPFTVDL